MNAAKWSGLHPPPDFSDYIHRHYSARKERLFVVGCCREMWDILDESARQAVLASEGYADRLVTDDELRAARQYAVETDNAEILSHPEQFHWEIRRGHAIAIDSARKWLGRTSQKACDATELVDAKSLTRLRLCVFGNPFRLVAFDPRWRTSTSVALAQTIYDERAFNTLPILADALEDAGCELTDILAHCRGPGPHVRGCWVVDLVLGKE